MEKRKLTLEQAVSAGLISVAMLQLLLTGCVPSPTKVPTPRPTETPPSGEIIQPPVVVVCSLPNRGDKAVLLVALSREGDYINLAFEAREGSEKTKQDKDGNIIPYLDLVKTGIDREFPYGISTAQDGTKKLLTMSLKNCIVPPEDLPRLKNLLEGGKFQNPGNQISYNGIPAQFTPSVVNPRGNTNPFRGNIFDSRAMRSSQPQVRQGRRM